jgi:hypothetical protein
MHTLRGVGKWTLKAVANVMFTGYIGNECPHANELTRS